jgi:hypothetical protein
MRRPDLPSEKDRMILADDRRCLRRQMEPARSDRAGRCGEKPELVANFSGCFGSVCATTHKVDPARRSRTGVMTEEERFDYSFAQLGHFHPT